MTTSVGVAVGAIACGSGCRPVRSIVGVGGAIACSLVRGCGERTERPVTHPPRSGQPMANSRGGGGGRPQAPVASGAMGQATVLVVEDDASIGRALTGALRAQGLEVLWATTGADALELAAGARAQLVLLDLGLPDLDGVEVCRRIRRGDAHVPIVILTARHSEVDVVLGLDAGADDYVTKPFRLAELLARVRAHLRRSTVASPPMSTSFTVGDVELDRDARRVHVDGRE